MKQKRLDQAKCRKDVETMIKVNDIRIDSVKKILKECKTLIMPQQLIDDICGLIVSIEDYNSVLKDVYKSMPTKDDSFH